MTVLSQFLACAAQIKLTGCAFKAYPTYLAKASITKNPWMQNVGVIFFLLVPQFLDFVHGMRALFSTTVADGDVFAFCTLEDKAMSELFVTFVTKTEGWQFFFFSLLPILGCGFVITFLCCSP